MAKTTTPDFEILSGSITIKGTRYPHAQPDPLEWCATCQRFHVKLRESERVRAMDKACTAQDRAAKLLATSVWRGASVREEIRQVVRALPVQGPLGKGGRRVEGVARRGWDPAKGCTHGGLPTHADTIVATPCVVLTLGTAECVLWGRVD